MINVDKAKKSIARSKEEVELISKYHPKDDKLKQAIDLLDRAIMVLNETDGEETNVEISV